jgi:cell fate regulator YaaT (PSP1 superfamily)
VPEIVGVRYKRAGKIYSFDPQGVTYQPGDRVVVRTISGLEIAEVALASKEVSANEIEEALRPVLRKVTAEDSAKAAELEEKAREAEDMCRELVGGLKLKMKLRRAEYNLDGNRLTIYFTAEDRVDFRQLVRDLSSRLKAKVELRQIGPRDEAKMVGGYGRCGLPLCCQNMLRDFDPVSIKMAKEQNLPLNPMKISGTCGRLLCCLTYECQFYREAKKNMPREGKRIFTPQGPGKVNAVNPIKGLVRVYLDTKVTVEFPVDSVSTEEIVPPPKAELPPPSRPARPSRPPGREASPRPPRREIPPRSGRGNPPPPKPATPPLSSSASPADTQNPPPPKPATPPSSSSAVPPSSSSTAPADTQNLAPASGRTTDKPSSAPPRPGQRSSSRRRRDRRKSQGR